MYVQVGQAGGRKLSIPQREREGDAMTPMGREKAVLIAQAVGITNEMTGPQAASLLAQKYALKLECAGLKFSRGSVYAHVKRLYGLKGNKQKVYEEFARLVDEAIMKRELPTKRASEQTR